MSDVFVSYSRRDTGYVASLAAELRARDKEVWVDTEGLADAEVFPAALRAAIEQADAFVYVISPEAASSRYCTTEVDHAHGLGKRIVPVLLRPVSDDELPPEIRDRNWIPADAADALPRLLTAIDTDREHVRAHTRWTGRAVEWEQSGREGSLLPRGSELSAGEAWLAACDPGADPAPTRSQQELLLAARRAATRRQRRLLGGAVGALLISLGLLVFALISRHAVAEQRTIARAQAFAARSDAALTLSPLAALHLARSAVQTRADPRDAPRAQTGRRHSEPDRRARVSQGRRRLPGPQAGVPARVRRARTRLMRRHRPYRRRPHRRADPDHARRRRRKHDRLPAGR